MERVVRPDVGDPDPPAFGWVAWDTGLVDLDADEKQGVAAVGSEYAGDSPSSGRATADFRREGGWPLGAGSSPGRIRFGFLRDRRRSNPPVASPSEISF